MEKKISYRKYVRPYISAFIIGPILMIVEVIGEVVMPRLLACIIDNGINGGRGTGYMLGIGAVMVVTALLMMAGGVGGAYYAIKASSGFANDLRKDVFRKVQQFSFANIDKFSTGSLVTRLTNDITLVQNVIMMMLRLALRAPGMLIGALIMTFIINVKLGLVILAIIPILSVVLFIIIKIGFPRFNLMQRKLDALNTTTQENLTNIRVVKSFVRESYEEDKFKNANEDLKEKTLRAMNVVILMMPVMTLAMNVTTLLVVWLGGNLVAVGGMSVGELTNITTYIIQILSSLMMLSMILLNSSRAMASSKRIREVLETDIDLNDDNAAMKDKKVERGSIEFRNVSFRYYKENEEKVLDNICFKVEPGQTVGIIGSTGCGKTSLVQMIPRLYDADEGCVLVDGVNVRDYSLKNLREGVGMVLQKNVLFSGTIMENLRWGDEDADEEDVYRMASHAQADTFVKNFTMGYDTELGQGGVNVSGGQKQRLCIARALLKKPKILILDDSTSAVDTATEAKIRESFRTDLKNTTKLIIAQRISSVADANLIIVMDEGKITGMGSHEELLKTCGEYQEIYYSQMDKEVRA